MSGKGSTERVHGPYQHGNRWRVVIVDARGKRTHARERSDGPLGFETRAAAEDFMAGFREAAEGRTIGSAVADYLEHFRRYGNKNRPPREVSVTTAKHKLTSFFQLPVEDRVLTQLTGKYAAKLYRDRVQVVKVDTHRGELALAGTFARWCVIQGWLRADPFAAVRPEGERSQGKPTLRMDDAERYLRACLSEGSKQGLAAATLLLLGLRVSELANRVVSDLDERGTVISIPRGKNRSSVRRIRLPEELQSGFAALVRGKIPSESIFGMSRYAMYHHVQRLCGDAGVPVVCCHGLRGTGTSTAVELGVSLDKIQRAIGHEVGSKVTERHYIAPGTKDNARVARLGTALGPTPDLGNRMGTPITYEFPAPQIGAEVARKEDLN